MIQRLLSQPANGIDGLAARLESMLRCKRWICNITFFAQTFPAPLLFAPYFEQLTEACAHGVLVDDGESVAEDERLFALAPPPDSDAGIQPFNNRGHNQAARTLAFVFHKKCLDHRTHNELFVADNAISLVGGRKKGDQ